MKYRDPTDLASLALVEVRLNGVVQAELMIDAACVDQLEPALSEFAKRLGETYPPPRFRVLRLVK